MPAAVPFSARIAAELNPELALNPPAAAFGLRNAILSGTSRQYYVPNFRGPLSLKATLQGTSTWTVSERECRVSESTYLLVNAGQPYTIAFDEPSDVTTFCLLFRDGYLEEIAAARGQTRAALLDEPFAAAKLEFPVRLHAGPSSVLARLRSFANELGTHHAEPELWELRFHQLAVALLEEVDSSAPRQADIAAAKVSTRLELLRRVSIGRDFLISMSDRPVSVEDAARAAFLSTFHFFRAFRQVFGLSPHAFLRGFRMQRASHLVCCSELPISEIARKVGFASVGSFGNAFVRTFGAAPQAHRAAHRVRK